MKFLIDMNLTPRWAAALQAAGHLAVHWSTIGAGDAGDSEIVSHARDHGMIILTHDLDFSTILALTGWNKPSVVQIRAEDTSPESIGVALTRAIAQTAAELEAGAVLTVEPVRSRMRLLPLQVMP